MEIEIQLQDQDGVWLTIVHGPNDPQFIRIEMERLSEIYPDLRVRAIDRSGRLVDMM